MTRTILVTGCGAFTGLEVCRSLRRAGTARTVVGSELSWWGEEIGGRVCDRVVRVPRAAEPGYKEAFLGLLAAEDVGLAFVNHDAELEAIAGWQDEVGAALSCPGKDALATCLDKAQTYRRIGSRLALPGTVEIVGETSVAGALANFGSPVWLRCASGQSGAGSIAVESAEFAMAWIAFWERKRGETVKWIAHEYLPGRNLNVTMLWHEGELITSCAGERLKYFLAEGSASGITGNITHGRIVPGREINDQAVVAVTAISERPEGIFSLDFREDSNGKPRLTEINGRQAFRPLLFTEAGVNFSKIQADLVLDGRRPELPAMDAGRAGVEIVRGMDFEPIFRTPEDQEGGG